MQSVFENPLAPLTDIGAQRVSCAYTLLTIESQSRITGVS